MRQLLQLAYPLAHVDFKSVEGQSQISYRFIQFDAKLEEPMRQLLQLAYPLESEEEVEGQSQKRGRSRRAHQLIIPTTVTAPEAV